MRRPGMPRQAHDAPLGPKKAGCPHCRRGGRARRIDSPTGGRENLSVQFIANPPHERSRLPRRRARPRPSVRRFRPGAAPRDGAGARSACARAISCSMRSAARWRRAARSSRAGSPTPCATSRAPPPRRREAAVIGFAGRLPMRDAALLNGMLMHGLDYDDTHMAGIVHLTVSVLPTLLAVAARRGSSGAAVVDRVHRGDRGGHADRERRSRRLSSPGLSSDRRRRRVRERAGGRPADRPRRRRPGARAGHRLVDGVGQPAVPRGRRLDQAPASRLGGAGGNHRRDLRGARHPGAGRRVRRPLRPLQSLPRRAARGRRSGARRRRPRRPAARRPGS